VTKLRNEGTSVRLFTIGKKAGAYFRFRGLDVEQSFTGFVDRPTFGDARLVASAVAAPFIEGEAQQVLLVSTRFLSAGTQAIEVQQLLPLSVPEMVVDDTPKKLKGYTEFEPEVEKLLTSLAPRALESEIFSALLEGAAAFHTSQQRAMAAASENADELGQTLSRIMNRARQDSITTEIMEIVSGAEALRSGK
jgi:F-type H+-transporting ATPase subunit gamma